MLDIASVSGPGNVYDAEYEVSGGYEITTRTTHLQAQSPNTKHQ
jgi:hypothetical protein